MSRPGKAVMSWILCAGLAISSQIGVMAAPAAAGTDVPAVKDGAEAASELPGGQSAGQTPNKEDWENSYDHVHEQSFTSDYKLNGLFDSCTGYFNVGEWKADRAVFVMEYSASQLLDYEVSCFTVSVNQTPVLTRYLSETGENGGGSVAIELPVEALLTGETNSLSVDVYLRGKDTGACVDDSGVSSWMNIFRESRVIIGYEALNQADAIDSFYRKFTSIEALGQGDSAVAVQSDAGESALTAMAWILSGVSKNAVLNYHKIQSRMTEGSDALKDYRYAIYICEYDRLEDKLKSRMNSRQKSIAESGAVICLLPLDDGRRILLITGNGASGLECAGRMLSNADYMEQLTTDTVEADPKKDYSSKSHDYPEYSKLTENGVLLNGVFRQEASFGIDYPASRRLSASCQLSLDYRYSEGLDYEKSLLTVMVNNIPVGSRPLVMDGAGQSTAVFELPQNLDLTGSFTVKAVFDLIPEGEWCNLTEKEAPWAYICDTSMLKLSFVDNTDLSFSSFPSPFVRDGHMNQVQIILPQKPGDGDISAMGSLLLTLGRFLKDNTGSLKVRAGAEPDGLSDSNLISIGKAAENELLRQNTSILAFSYDGSVSSNGGIALDASFAEKSGTAQLAASPYSDQFYALLVISAQDESGLSCPMEYLGDTDKLWELTGNAFLTDGDIMYEIHSETSARPEAPVKESLLPQEAKPVLAVAAAVIFLAALAGVMLFIRYRKETADE